MKMLNVIFVIAFILILMIPLVTVDLSNNMISEQENRMLSPKPALSDIWNTPTRFIKEFDSWFSDHVGLRKVMIDINQKLEKVGGTGYFMDGSFRVLVGKEGHHFNTSYGRTLFAYQGKPYFSDRQAEELASKLTEMKEWFDQQGIYFIVMITTNKESTYPEYYPTSVIRGEGLLPVMKAVQYFDTHTDIDIFSTVDCLLKEKEKYLLYPKTGNAGELLHYNETGAFIAYRELMKHINAYYPDLHSYTLDDVDMVYKYNGSSTVTLKGSVDYQQVESSTFAGDLTYENKDMSLPTLLLMRDSYADWFPNYLPQHFGKTIFHHWNTLEYLEEYVESYKPDIVVFEVVERTLVDFAEVMMKY